MRRAALLTALLVVLAGCGGVADVAVTEPPDDPTPEPTDTPTTDVQVIGGDLPFDATTAFERVLNLTGERVNGPVVYVESPAAMERSILDSRRSGFRAALGVNPPPRNSSERLRLAAYAPADGNAVHVNEAILANGARAEVTVVHEFVHTVQFQRGWHESVWSIDPAFDADGISYDRQLTYYLVIEGAATVVENEYRSQFATQSAGGDSLRASYRNASASGRLNLARYVLGAEYVAERTDSLRDLAEVHRHPPKSSEQVLHNSTDPVEHLLVTTTDTGNWTERGRDRQGELFLRIALRTELNRSTAVDAAHGWGEDRRITFERGTRTGTAWVLHWDDSANATEFETAFERYLEAKATRNDGVWSQTDGTASYRVVEATDETTVVFLGEESFVRTATVEESREDVFDIEVER
mgnify:CR=1 FL=1